MKRTLYFTLLTFTLLFLGFIAVRMLTAPTDLTIVENFNLPPLTKISDLIPDTNQSRIAIAIDHQIAYTNNSEIQPTASTAKMITALAVMQKKPFSYGETGETITITPEDYNIYSWYLTHNGSNTAVIPGEKISEYDALTSMLLASSNNMADTLAIWAFGNLENYRTYATAMLAEFGLTDTTIGQDASGYHEDTTSSPEDLALIGQKVLENPVLAEIVSTKSHRVPIAGLLQNTNQLLGENGIIGVKTGYIGEPSGYCLITGYLEKDDFVKNSPVSSEMMSEPASSENHLITIAVLNAKTRATSFNLSREIVEGLRQKLVPSVVLTAGTEIGSYKSWWSDLVPIKLAEDLTVFGWEGAPTQTTLEMEKDTGKLKLDVNGFEYVADVKIETNFDFEPTFFDRLKYALFLIN